jgi:GNAT superfamily N-acetyltransferase
METLGYREMRPEEAPAVQALVWRVFCQFEGADYAPEGVREFESFIQPHALALRREAGNFALVCEAGEGGELVGVLEMRRPDHLVLLFVDARYQRRGVARELWRRALARCRVERPDLRRVTVNSSRYAVPVYERLGFRATGGERVQRGVRFVPMVLELTPLPAGPQP